MDTTVQEIVVPDEAHMEFSLEKRKYKFSCVHTGIGYYCELILPAGEKMQWQVTGTLELSTYLAIPNLATRDENWLPSPRTKREFQEEKEKREFVFPVKWRTRFLYELLKFAGMTISQTKK